ncbi:hypothetical protein BOTCAL_0316g00010 [Botryotinia calthae]|uniref:Uncharacterized protein n=1 Tax=Botryotinia calthae TaxID=38488 RepID=A0A4Y8CTU9_9HELO|nr:hypothetical protein BOTCAL_0316g00010 [Botryotinia calthae]
MNIAEIIKNCTRAKDMLLRLQTQHKGTGYYLYLNDFDSIENFTTEYKPYSKPQGAGQINTHIKLATATKDKILSLTHFINDFKEEMRKNGGLDEHGSVLFRNKARGAGQAKAKERRTTNLPREEVQIVDTAVIPMLRKSTLTNVSFTQRTPTKRRHGRREVDKRDTNTHILWGKDKGK